MEANLFLSVSNGDSYASFEELHHIFLHIISGLARSKTMEPKMAKCILEKGSAAIKSALSRNCLLQVYLEEDEAFEDLPEFLNLKTATNPDGTPMYSPESNKQYYLSLLKAAGYIPQENVPDDQQTVQLGKAELFPHVVQYVEMLFATHETNANLKLEKEEALGAFPVFKKLLWDAVIVLKLDKKLKETDLPGLFIWIIKNKRIPNITPPAPGVPAPDNPLQLILFIRDPKQKDWGIEATRHDLGDVFNIIANAAKPKSPPPNPPPQPPSPQPTPEPAPQPSPVPPADPVTPPASPEPAPSPNPAP
jgi:hypothetical protein